MDATSQVEPCVRPCLNRPKSEQKSSEEDGPNGPSPGMSSDNQDARHVAHVGQDAGEAETNQFSRFQHLEKMVKLTATHVGLSQDSDPICSDADDGSDPDWSPNPNDDHGHVDITGVIPDPRPPQKRRKVDDPLCSKSDDRVAEKDGIFFRLQDAIPDTFDVDDGIAEYVSSYLYSTISDVSFRAIMESTKNPNINFFQPPLLNSSVANILKSSENMSLTNGDRFLSKPQSFLTAAATAIIGIWQNIIDEKDQITVGEILHCLQQSIVLLGSTFNSLPSFRRHRLKSSLWPEFAILIKELDSDHKPSRFLFGDELASKIKNLSEESKFLKKISSSTIKKPFRRVAAAAQYQRKSSGPRFDSRRVVFKSKFHGKSKHSRDRFQKTKSENSSVKIRYRYLLISP